jgi:predicted nuclease of restriction endonuclease-like (RecB) superfamily
MRYYGAPGHRSARAPEKSREISIRDRLQRRARVLRGEDCMGVNQLIKPSLRDYRSFIESIKSKIRIAQIKASLSVNAELIRLYWDIGRLVVERQKKDGWGTAVIKRISSDIQKGFPGIEGFSSSNISRMRTFYLAWKGIRVNSAQPVPKLKNKDSAQAVPKMMDFLCCIPWGHHVVLLFKLKKPVERLWYAQKTLENGWSRIMLTHQIEGGAYFRYGKAITNFKATLPSSDSDFAKQIIKDPYNFDFLTLSHDHDEQVLEAALIDEVQKFLLELGTGFSFVGRQVHLKVGNQDFYIDLLFYHLKLRCFIVIDLKTETFRPEFAGKMNFYLSAVDNILKHEDDKRSIGIILCKTRDKVVAEYALQDIKKPMGISSYVTKLVEKLPQKFEGMLPSVKDIEKELS